MMNLKKISKLNIIYIIFLVIVVSNVYYFSKKSERDLRNKLENEYEKIESKEEVKGEIVSLYYPKNWREGSINQYIKLDNGKKYSLRIRPKPNYPYLNEILECGTLVEKDNDSDTILLKNNSKEYFFLISNSHSY